MRKRRYKKKKDEWPFAPEIIAPDGRLLFHARQIPDLPMPKHIVVREDYLFLDGWFILIWPLRKTTLQWFACQTKRWVNSDPEAKTQICGILDAMETLVNARNINSDASQS